MKARIIVIMFIMIFGLGCSANEYGKTPEEAVNKTNRKIAEVIHKEPVKDGVVIFYRKEVYNGTTLASGYVKKSFLGWKWIYGGEHDSYTHQYFPYVEGTPFPLVFGNIEDKDISKVVIEDVKNKVKLQTKQFNNNKLRVWFTFLDKNQDTASLRVVWLNEKGDVIKTDWVCNIINGTETNTDLLKLSPNQLVETYYTSIASRDYSTAKDCLADEISKQYQNSPDSDLTNIKKLTDLKVSPAVSIKLYGKNFDEMQVIAEYDAQYKDEITSGNGKQIRFIYVGKKKKDSPWKIISIGTGP